jgi:ribosome-associated protein
MQEPKQTESDIIKSRTQTKNDAHDLKDFGKKLIELNEKQIKSLPLDETVIDNILDAKTMTKTAFKRQLQYVGKLLRSCDMEPIYDAYNKYTSQSVEDTALLHRIEKLRLRLLDSETSKMATTEFLSKYPYASPQILRQLIRNTLKEQKENKPVKNFRELFQFIKNAMTTADPT